MGRENCEATRTGAEVKHRIDRFRIGQQGYAICTEYARLQQFTNVRTRNDDAFIHKKWNALHVNLVEQVGSRLSRADPVFDVGDDLVALCFQQCSIQPRVDVMHRQMERLENDESGFVNCACGAVSVDELCFGEAADGITEQVTRRFEDVCHVALGIPLSKGWRWHAMPIMTSQAVAGANDTARFCFNR